ncbi:MAG: UV damage endonuclease UvsE, partial [Chloroflexus aggregans]
GRNGTTRVLPPRAGQHADFIVAQDALALLAASRGLPPFDLMLEAKAGDLALLRLRHDLHRYAPEWVACVQ